MSKKKKGASKQHGSDKVFQDNEGLFFATAAIHQGRTTTVMQSPKVIEIENARMSLNDGLYRNGLPKI